MVTREEKLAINGGDFSSSKEVHLWEEPVGINEEEWVSLLLLGW